MGKNTMERQNFIIDNLVVEEDRAEEELSWRGIWDLLFQNLLFTIYLLFGNFAI
jgi:hypothetical protein